MESELAIMCKAGEITEEQYHRDIPGGVAPSIAPKASGQKIITADERKAQYARDENQADIEAKTVIGTIAPFLAQFSDDVQALDLSGMTPDIKQSLIQILTTMGDLGYRLAQHVDGRGEDIAA